MTPPTRVIDGDISLDLDGVSVRLLHVGPAHTEGDLIVHLPEEGVVATGDILFNRCAPIGWEGSTDRWIAALRTIEALAPAHVIPGHGPVCEVSDVRAARSYLEDVRAFASECWRRGDPVLDCCEKLDLGPFADWGEPWRLAATVHRIYRERAGASWDAAFDSGEVMNDVHALRQR
jgi:glyoxylase-like metal-dependent hydrolase (beta-lactamase superfamily II)